MMNSGTQRAELHKTIWSIANVLRGSVDGWDFKQYVLGFLFYRFISEDITSYLNEYEHQAGDVDFDYAKLDDATAEQVRKSMVEEKGYFILPSDLFANVRRRADADENLNETLQRVFKNIEGLSHRLAFGIQSARPVRRFGPEQPQARRHRGGSQRQAGEGAQCHWRSGLGHGELRGQ